MDLVDHLQGKLSTRLETTDSSAPLSNKGTGTQSGNELTSTLAPEMKVSFNTQEKMPWNTKKRYESLMMSRIKPSLTHINSKSAVEVIGVSVKPHFHHPRQKPFLIMNISNSPNASVSSHKWSRQLSLRMSIEDFAIVTVLLICFSRTHASFSNVLL